MTHYPAPFDAQDLIKGKNMTFNNGVYFQVKAVKTACSK